MRSIRRILPQRYSLFLFSLVCFYAYKIQTYHLFHHCLFFSMRVCFICQFCKYLLYGYLSLFINIQFVGFEAFRIFDKGYEGRYEVFGLFH